MTMTNSIGMIQATTQQGTPQAPTPPTREQTQAMQDAAQRREALRQMINARINAQANEAAARALRDQNVTVVGPRGPGIVGGIAQDGPITIQTPDGKTTIVRAGPQPGDEIPPQAVEMAYAFFFTVAAIIILLPLARALARRMDRRSAPAQVPPEVTTQLEHLNRAVDAIALEVERISEGQRFTTRLLTERESAPGLPTGANR